MGPGQSIANGLKNSLSVNGRASRSEFWWFAPPLFAMLMAVAWFEEPSWLTGTLLRHLTVPQYAVLLFGILALPVYSAIIRRLRDAGIPTALSLLLPVYVLAAIVTVPIIDASPAYGMHSLTRLMPEAGLAFMGYLALIAIFFVLCAIPTRHGPNPAEVTP